MRVALLFVIASTMVAPRTVRGGAPREEIAAALSERLERLASEGRFSGAMVVLQEERPPIERAWGDRGDGKPPDARTTMWIASLTKSITAAAIFRLQDQRKLSVDDPVERYFPSVADGVFRGPDGDAVTIDHLLTHTSGLDLPPLGDIREQPLSQEELSASLAKIEGRHTPGTTVHYTNAAFVLLGMIVEHVSGQSYAEFATSEVLIRAGLERTGFGKLPPDNVGAGMQLGLFGLEPAGLQRRIETAGAAGAAYSCARDLARWPHALAGGNVLSREARDRMFTPLQGRQARGWVYEEAERGHPEFVWHNGGWSPDGFQSFLAWFPEAKLSVAVVSNADEGSVSLTPQCMAVLRGIEDPLAQPPSVPWVWRAWVTYKARHWGVLCFIVVFGLALGRRSRTGLQRLRRFAATAMVGNVLVLSEPALVRAVCFVAGAVIVGRAYLWWRRSDPTQEDPRKNVDAWTTILVVWAAAIFVAGMLEL